MIEQTFKWTPFLAFAFASAMTPGPNVILLMTSGSAWGFRQTIPHLIGVCLGFPLMFLLVQFGAGVIFSRFPSILLVVTLLSLGYVLWLSLRIFEMGNGAQIHTYSKARPMSFTEAVLFQWVNGKAWQIVITAATLYSSGSPGVKVLSSISFVGVLIICGSAWIELGRNISRFLERPAFRKIYYSSLALLLLLATVPAGWSQLNSLAPTILPRCSPQVRVPKDVWLGNTSMQVLQPCR